MSDLALALAAVAGADESDPRQRDVRPQDYRRAVAEAPDDLRGVVVGVLREGFEHDRPGAPEGTRASAEATRGVVEELAALGAEVREVSVPEHRYGAGLMFAAIAEGQTAITTSFGQGYGWRGRYAPDLSLALGRGLRVHGDELPPSLKMVLLLGTHLREHYFGSLYGKAQNLTPRLREAVDRALAEVDVLVLPTATHYAHVYRPDATLSERVLRGDSMIGNTGTFDATGHPALSLRRPRRTGCRWA